MLAIYVSANHGYVASLYFFSFDSHFLNRVGAVLMVWLGLGKKHILAKIIRFGRLKNTKDFPTCC